MVPHGCSGGLENIVFLEPRVVSGKQTFEHRAVCLPQLLNLFSWNDSKLKQNSLFSFLMIPSFLTTLTHIFFQDSPLFLHNLVVSLILWSRIHLFWAYVLLWWSYPFSWLQWLGVSTPFLPSVFWSWPAGLYFQMPARYFHLDGSEALKLAYPKINLLSSSKLYSCSSFLPFQGLDHHTVVSQVTKWGVILDFFLSSSSQYIWSLCLLIHMPLIVL